ncbi:hypothetical protein SK128_022643 [Halocaridina rubra]|uniref:Uncharacterized protein n=1 Tax=Halocaridina rubra TaxID=373956 RepID=A0AAN8XML3_HALRR
MRSISILRNVLKGTKFVAPENSFRFLSTQAIRPIVKENLEIVSPFPDVTPKKEFPVHLAIAAAQRWSHLTAFECGFTGVSYTFGDLLDAMQRFGGFLQRNDIGRGDIVAIFMPNSVHYPWVFIGIMMSGAAFTGINAAFTANELRYQLLDSGAKAVVVDPIMESVVEKAIADLPNPPSVYVTGPSQHGRVNLVEVTNDKNTPFATLPEFRADDVLGILYSSGTTGLPKGVKFLNRSVSTHIPMMLHPDIYPIEPATNNHQDTVIGLMPFFHAYGIYTILISSLLMGTKVVTLPLFDPETFIELHKRHKVRVIHLVPPILKFLVTNPMVKAEDLEHIRVALCGAAPCPAEVAQAFKEKAPHPIFFQELFGMTETMPTHLVPIKGKEKLGSCGPLLPNTRAKVVNLSTGVSLPRGEEGELYIKSPVLPLDYHNRPEATSELFSEDGWLKTGDVAKYDEDGYFYIVDRIKELIKVKGNQVSPSELENYLLQHPGIADVGVIGVNDPRFGEKPRAYVVKKLPSLTESDVIEYLKDKVAPYKQLAGGVKFVDELPKNPTGKLLRKIVKEWAMKE